MDKNKVYIGVYKDNNKESLFYQKDINTYYDLKEKSKVNSNEIHKNSLIPYKDIIECKSSLKRNIIKLYDLDRIQKISLNKVFLGDIFEMENVCISREFNQTEDRLDIETSEGCFVKKVKESALLLALSSFFEKNEDVDIHYDNFIDMETGTIYDDEVVVQNGTQYLPRTSEYLIPIKKVIYIKDEKIEKGKLLEKYRDYKKRYLSNES